MMKKLPKTVVIIGSGIGGLATAALLARAGVKVTIVEKETQVGGRMGWLEAEGFSFDTGPSWFLMPEIFEHFFASLGEDMHQLLDMRRLDPAYKVFFESEVGPLEIFGDSEKDAVTFESLEPGAGDALRRYLKQAEKTYYAATDSFLYTNFDNYAAFLKPKVLGSVPQIGVAALQSIDRYVSKYIASPELKQLLEYHMVFLGTSPYSAPSLFRLMGYMDFCQGVFYPQGGMYSIITAMVSIAKKYGVTIRTNMPVEQILTNGKHATGVQCAGGEKIKADVVISNADVHHTETKLLPENARSYSDTYFNKQTTSPSALLMYLGVKGALPELTHHNLFFSRDWRKNFGDIIDRKKWPEPASIYVSKPSETDPNVAPEGHENVFVLVPVPSGPCTMNDEEIGHFADTYLNQIAAYAGIKDLTKRIVYKKLFGPNDFATTYNTWQGSMLGPAHTLFQSALWRTANISKKLDNLYYAGATTMPGIGMPMCLISAELVYKRLVGDKSITPLPTPFPENIV